MKSLIVLIISSFIALSAYAQVSGTLSYQGFLTAANGDPVNDNLNHKVTFKFYVGTSITEEFTRGPIVTKVDKGVFTVTIGSGTVGNEPTTENNDALAVNIWSKEYRIGIVIDENAELPKISLTAVPYAFQAQIANVANSVSGANVTSGINAANITAGTLANDLLDADLVDLAEDGILTGSKVGTGINATNITTGTLSGALLDGVSSTKLTGIVTVANGGTGATTATLARTNLGLAIGTDVQANDAGLNSIAGLTTVVDQIIYTTAVDTYSTTAVSQFVRENILDKANASAVRTALGLTVGSGGALQPYDADLDIYAGITPSADVQSLLGATNVAAILTGIGAQANNAHLTDLADGTLTGSKVGTGINAANITLNSLAVANGGTGATTLTGALIGNGTSAISGVSASGASQYLRRNSGNTAYEFGGIDAAHITSGTLPNNRLSSYLLDVSDGTLSDLSVVTNNGIPIGNNNVASGTNSLAMGNNNSAEGNYSVTIGSYVRTTSTGTVYIGDRSVSTQSSGTSANRLYARFSNGYALYSASDLSAGVSLAAGGTSWGTVSDSTKKENFKTVDYEAILGSISKLKLGTWNYKFHDSSIRHYGPYAQEFYAAFGKDDIGQIGCDTLINTQDISGLNITAIKALVLRTEKLMQENEELKRQLAEIQKKENEIELIKKNYSAILTYLGIKNEKEVFSINENSSSK